MIIKTSNFLGINASKTSIAMEKGFRISPKIIFIPNLGPFICF